VRAGLDDRFETRSLGPVELRGISRPLEVHEVIGTIGTIGTRQQEVDP
jgi:class 3 adenylate cyclase